MVDAREQSLFERMGTLAWGWLFVTGLFMLAVGVLALLESTVSGVVSIIFLGALLSVTGVAELALAFRMSRGDRAYVLLGGLFSFVVGLLFLVRPAAGLGAVTFLLAGFFFATGLFRLVTSIGDRYPHWGWDLFYGLSAIVLGIIVVSEWPISALWLVGTLVGIELMLRGASRMGAGLSLRSALHHREQFAA